MEEAAKAPKKTLAQKDTERAQKMITEAEKRTWRTWIKGEIEDMELNIKYYTYQMQLSQVYAKWQQWQDSMTSPVTSLEETGIIPEPKEEEVKPKK